MNKWLIAPDKPGWWWYLRLGEYDTEGTTSLSMLFVCFKEDKLMIQIGENFINVDSSFLLEWNNTPSGEWGMWHGPIKCLELPKGLRWDVYKYIEENKDKPIPQLFKKKCKCGKHINPAIKEDK